MKEEDVLIEAVDDAPNVLTLCVLVLLTCTAAGNYGNSVSSVIVMVLVVELIDCDQRSFLLLQSVYTMEYPLQPFFCCQKLRGFS